MKIADTTVGLTAPNFVPTGANPVGGDLAWKQIWQDQLTGLYLTNPVSDGATQSWADSYRICTGIDSGDGAGNWRLPTEKELMQLYIDGISNIAFPAAGQTNHYFWSASALSSDNGDAWVVNLSRGYTYYFYVRYNTANWALCVK